MKHYSTQSIKRWLSIFMSFLFLGVFSVGTATAQNHNKSYDKSKDQKERKLTNNNPLYDAKYQFIRKLKLPNKQTVVVADGHFESRSMGSLSVRLYDAPYEEDTLDESSRGMFVREVIYENFLSGLIHTRDGSLESASFGDLDKDGQAEIIVTARSAGTGNYISAYAFKIDNNVLSFWKSVEDLPPDANPVAALME